MNKPTSRTKAKGRSTKRAVKAKRQATRWKRKPAARPVITKRIFAGSTQMRTAVLQAGVTPKNLRHIAKTLRSNGRKSGDRLLMSLGNFVASAFDAEAALLRH